MVLVGTSIVESTILLLPLLTLMEIPNFLPVSRAQCK